MALNAATLGAALASAAGSVDPVGVAKWLAIATAIVSHFQSNAEVLPTGTPVLTAPTGGGPVTGKGVIN